MRNGRGQQYAGKYFKKNGKCIIFYMKTRFIIVGRKAILIFFLIILVNNSNRILIIFLQIFSINIELFRFIRGWRRAFRRRHSEEEEWDGEYVEDIGRLFI